MYFNSSLPCVLSFREINGSLSNDNVALWQFLTKEELLNKLLSVDVKTAISAIKITAICEKLTFIERLKVFCRYDIFSKAIYDNKEILQKLNGSALAVVGQNNYEVAISIVSDLKLLEKMSSNDLVEIASNIPAVALFIINKMIEKEDKENEADKFLKREISAKLSRYYLMILGQKFIDVADTILSTPYFLEKMQSDGIFIESLAILCKDRSEVVFKHFDEQFFFTLSSEELGILGKNNAKISNYILNNPALRSKLKITDLVCLGKNCPEQAKLILKDSSLCSELSGADLVLLCQNHFDIFELVLKDVNLCVKLDGFCLAKIGQGNVMIARHILGNQELCSKVKRSDLAILGAKKFEIANIIINTPKLCNSLDGYELALLAQNHLEIADRIHKNPKLLEKLDGLDLYHLGSKTIEIAKMILKHKPHAEVLDVSDLCELAADNLEAATIIFNTPALLEKITESDDIVEYFCQNVPELIKLVISKCEQQYIANDEGSTVFHKIKENQALYAQLSQKVLLWETCYETCLGAINNHAKNRNGL